MGLRNSKSVVDAGIISGVPCDLLGARVSDRYTGACGVLNSPASGKLSCRANVGYEGVLSSSSCFLSRPNSSLSWPVSPGFFGAQSRGASVLSSSDFS